MSLTKLQVQSKYPEVYESYTLQASLPEAKYVEKLKFWEGSSINCFERWTIPYFLEREKEKKRPCLRLNYPPDGKCNDCTRGTCRYDRICFMCGMEGHGAFQSFPGGKLKGELKCAKHRNFLSQLGMIRLQHGIDEDGLRTLFKLPGYNAEKAVKKVNASAAPAPAKAPAAAGAAADTAKESATAATGTAATTTAAAAVAVSNDAAESKGKEPAVEAAAPAASGRKAEPKQPSPASGAAAAAPAAGPVKGAGKKATPAAAAPATAPLAPTAIAAAAAPAVAVPAAAPVQTTAAAADGTNWQLDLNGPAGFLGTGGTMGSAALNYDTLLEDTGRRPWASTAAAPAGPISALDAPKPPALLGMPGNLGMSPSLLGGSAPAGSRLAGLSLPSAAGNAPSNSSLFPSMGGGNLNVMASFDALSLASNGGAGLNGLAGALPGNMTSPPQSGFGMSNLPGMMSALGMPGMMGNSSLHGMPPLAPPALQQFQHAFEVVDCDEYVAPGTLRVTLSNMARDESSGSYVTKGAYLTHRGIQEVAVRSWKKTAANASVTDHIALRAELRALRVLSRKCVHVSKILHHGMLELTASATATSPAADYLSIVSETSDIGTLERFTTLQVSAMQAANASANAAMAATPLASAYTLPDLQSLCVQLIEGLIQCHELSIRHRDIRPANILVSRCSDEHYSRQFNRGLVVKYANFVPAALLPLCNANAGAEVSAPLGEADKWTAPEVDQDARRNGTRFQACSDVWSLGLTVYYLASNGQLPFDSYKQACDAASNPDYRRLCLEKHGLHERMPMLYDLVERLVRPAYMRTDLQIIRCHPFLWTMEVRKSMLTQFASATMLRNSETINAFVTGIDKISPLYVFGGDGWVAPMAPYLLSLVPTKLKADFWWSGTYLLQAVKAQLMYPELLQQSVYPRMTAHQATHAYVRQITDVDFPRLLILLYELGGIHGKWLWDGDEITHTWN